MMHSKPLSMLLIQYVGLAMIMTIGQAEAGGVTSKLQITVRNIPSWAHVLLAKAIPIYPFPMHFLNDSFRFFLKFIHRFHKVFEGTEDTITGRQCLECPHTEELSNKMFTMLTRISVTATRITVAGGTLPARMMNQDRWRLGKLLLF